MSPYPDEPDDPDGYRSVTDLLERPPVPINWNLLDAEQAEIEWQDLDQWVKWLKSTFGLPPNIVPPYWHRHDELVWELSALHCHWLSCYHESASPSAPLSWMREFADARSRLRVAAAQRSGVGRQRGDRAGRRSRSCWRCGRSCGRRTPP